MEYMNFARSCSLYAKVLIFKIKWEVHVVCSQWVFMQDSCVWFKKVNSVKGFDLGQQLQEQ